MKRHFLLSFVCVFALIIAAQVSAQEKITGPCLIVIAPTESGQGGAASNELDQLAAAGGASEDDVAKNGAKAGDKVGDLTWVEAEIPDRGGNNIQDLIDANKADWGGGWADLPADINDYSFYALSTIESPKDQPDVTMKIGSDDACRVWLNGEVVHTNSVNRGASDFQDEFQVNLKKGDNLLLVKSAERGGGWSVFFGINASFTVSGKDYVYKEPPPPAGEKITGPWLWVTTPSPDCGAAGTTTDWLAEASGGKVTEDIIAHNGAKEGAAVGDKVWTLGEISATGGNNMNDLVTTIGLGEGDVDNTVAYGFIGIKSAVSKDTFMYVGSDDAIKVWLNGDVVWENPVNRGAGDYQENFEISLKPGLNILLVAVYECGGGWSGFFGLAENVDFSITTPVEPAGKLMTTWGSIKKVR